jgi:hypothetical protein
LLNDATLRCDTDVVGVVAVGLGLGVGVTITDGGPPLLSSPPHPDRTSARVAATLGNNARMNKTLFRLAAGLCQDIDRQDEKRLCDHGKRWFYHAGPRQAQGSRDSQSTG